MSKISHFFILFLVCNATHTLHAMNDQNDHWNEHYQQAKDLTREKMDRQKKHRHPQDKKKHNKKANTQPKKATK
jgi:hypothetical protein